MTALSSARTAPAEVAPDSSFAPLDLESIFGSSAPLEVDLGCGDGLFLAALAVLRPDRNFLGTERLLNRVRATCRRIERERIENARVLRVENSYAVRYLLPPGSVAVFYLNFPDPWPKRRHHRRRLINVEFLQALEVALAPDGMVRIATDQVDYFQQIERVSCRAHGLVVDRIVAELPLTTFEKRFRGLGQEIYRLVLRKVSDVR